MTASLAARTAAVPELDEQTRTDAFALFRSAYAGADRARFERDLAEKQRIILLRDRATGQLKGFSTVLIWALATPRGPASVVFSGDTVIDREFWGQKQLQREFSRLMVRLKLRHPHRPLYWFLISKGYRTYLLLAHAFPRAVPRHDRADIPQLRAVLDRLARERFGSEYDPRAGLVRYATPHERVRAEVAPMDASLLADPHIRFFAERNPGHVDGDELACLAEVRLRDLARVACRIALVRARRRWRAP
ncbi:MAG: hypothetical protein M3409_10995 [Gemmatimonadota bacterium]|nr:hypothetical protein [Gemmatimonadota bacterium]